MLLGIFLHSFDHPSRNTNHHAVIGNIPSDNGPYTDDTITADAHPRHHRYTGADVDITAHLNLAEHIDFFCVFCFEIPAQNPYSAVVSDEGHISIDPHMIPKADQIRLASKVGTGINFTVCANLNPPFPPIGNGIFSQHQPIQKSFDHWPVTFPFSSSLRHNGARFLPHSFLQSERTSFPRCCKALQCWSQWGKWDFPQASAPRSES